MDKCPFCQVVAGESDNEPIAATDNSVAFFDRYPVGEGHALIIPRRHVSDLFDLDSNERIDTWALVDSVRELLSESFRPDGFNIGTNVGQAAGQTVAHAHIHVIPRYRGDVEDPRGGIRWVIPDRAPYWD